jgi:hypothetical protein
MLAVDLDFQLILLLLAGAVWVLGKAAERIKAIRDLTSGELRKRSEQRKIEWTSSDEDADSVIREQLEEAAAEAPVPRRPPRVARVPVPARAAAPRVRRPATVVHSKPRAAVRLGTLQPGRLKEAIVLREVLGPPVALRGRRRRW